MTTPELLTLRGCAPTPLASYLKALGVLRLISSDANHVDGKAADPEARGWWEKERFNLTTRLNRDALCHFFLEEYAPSPVIAPWNGGSGFFPKDNKHGFDPLCATVIAKRFLPIAEAINVASKVLARQGLTKRPEGTDKVELVATLRAEISDEALDWIDAALALSGSGLTYPQLLGTGGNDSRLEFTNNFMRRLVSTKKPLGIFNADSGRPSAEALPLLLNALFDTPASGLNSVAIGQFSPGSAGGPNATSGFDGAANVNPWEFILVLEGTIPFAGAATRRHQSARDSEASFPFTVKTVGAGWGGVEATDENDRRTAEFWAPLWNHAARFREVNALLVEGRAVLSGRTARNGLEFARAVSSLGISRGFSEFVRYGFLQRAGEMYLAAPAGRRTATPSIATQLVADLDSRGWLEKVLQVGRKKEEPTAARTTIKRFEDTLFDLANTAGTSLPAACIQSTLVALGEVCKWLSYSRKGREAVGAPPPLMSTDWIWRADDNSPEFRVAAALAGLGLTPMELPEGTELETTIETMEGIYAEAKENNVPQRPLLATLPMAAHFMPIDEARFCTRRAWSKEETPPSVVWDSRGLVSNMITVLERRFVENTIRGFKDKPLASAAFARLDDVGAFLSGDFDDARCAALLAGMIWVRPTKLSAKRFCHKDAQPTHVPFAYAALKPIFSPNQALHRIGAIAETEQMPIPPGLVAWLRSGTSSSDGRVTDAAVRAALARARSSGLPSPFESGRAGGRRSGAEISRIGAGIRPDRLAAALLIPIGDRMLKLLVERVYSVEIIESAKDT